MLYVFVDTNIYLSYLEKGAPNIVELERLRKLIEQRKIKLFITDQVIDEYKRNREGVAKRALAKLNQLEFKSNFPPCFRELGSYTALKEALGSASQEYSKLVREFKVAVKDATLALDIEFLKLQEKATVIESKSHVVDEALRRVQLGRPPKKSKDTSLGDALNWELLIKACSAGVGPSKSLQIVAEDGDYYSKFDPNEPSQYLLEEWRERVGKGLLFFKDLKEFFQDNSISVDVTPDQERKELISSFVASRSFVLTNTIAEQLLKSEYFDDADIASLVKALLENDQIYRVLGNEAVFSLYRQVFKSEHLDLDPSDKEKIRELFRDSFKTGEVSEDSESLLFR